MCLIFIVGFYVEGVLGKFLKLEKKGGGGSVT